MVYDPIGDEIGIASELAVEEARRRWEETRFIKISDKALRRFLLTGKTRSDGTRGSVIYGRKGGLKRLSLSSYCKLPPSFTDPQGVFIVGYNTRGQCYCAEYSQLKHCGWKEHK